MKGLILLADGFEDIEAITTIDLIRRGNIRIDIISMNETKQTISKSNITYFSDYTINDINYQDYNFLIIPGGSAVESYHLKSDTTTEIVNYFETNKLLIATICAAPSILGKLNYLNQENFTCYPTFEKYMPNGFYQKEKKVVVNNNHITSKAAGTSFEFAYQIIKYLKSEEIAKKVLNEVYY